MIPFWLHMKDIETVLFRRKTQLNFTFCTSDKGRAISATSVTSPAFRPLRKVVLTICMNILLRDSSTPSTSFLLNFTILTIRKMTFLVIHHSFCNFHCSFCRAFGFTVASRGDFAFKWPLSAEFGKFTGGILRTTVTDDEIRDAIAIYRWLSTVWHTDNTRQRTGFRLHVLLLLSSAMPRVVLEMHKSMTEILVAVATSSSRRG